MDNKKIQITLSSDEKKILSSIYMHNEKLRDFFQLASSQDKDTIFLEMDYKKCEDIRTELTELLARVGFDSEYKLTKTGKLLEDLIDNLYENR